VGKTQSVQKEQVGADNTNVNSVNTVNVVNDVDIGHMPIDVSILLAIITAIKIIEFLIYIFTQVSKHCKKKYAAKKETV
jgi:hypothetical protein